VSVGQSRRADLAFDPDEGLSCLQLRTTLTRNRGTMPLARRRKGTTGSAGLCGFDGLAHQPHRSVKVSWTLVHSVL